MSTTAGSLWNLQAIQSMCQIEQDKVSNVTKNIYTYCHFSDCHHLEYLAERKAKKNNISYRSGFSLENSRAFYLPSNIRMISPIPEVQLPLNKNTQSLGKNLVQKPKMFIRSCWECWAAEPNYQNGAVVLETATVSFLRGTFNRISCVCHRILNNSKW